MKVGYFDAAASTPCRGSVTACGWGVGGRNHRLARYGIGLSWSLAPDSVETSLQKPAIAEF